MTKLQEQQLIKTVARLEKQVAELHYKIENTKIDKHLYTVVETAQMLNKTPQAIYAMIERGELDTVKLGHTKVLGNSLREKLGGGINEA